MVVRPLRSYLVTALSKIQGEPMMMIKPSGLAAQIKRRTNIKAGIGIVKKIRSGGAGSSGVRATWRGVRSNIAGSKEGRSSLAKHVRGARNAFHSAGAARSGSNSLIKSALRST